MSAFVNMVGEHGIVLAQLEPVNSRKISMLILLLKCYAIKTCINRETERR